jgi:hypothetical protein
MTIYVIEGCDMLGKGTLIDGIINRKGYHPVIHFSRPKILEAYQNCLSLPEYEYQYSSFVNGFQLLETRVPMIFDRGWLGETVYGPLYRGTEADYVFELEKQFGVANWHHVKLILLTTSSWDFVDDDGQSFDVNNRVKEQWIFQEAFEKSIFPNKIEIDIMTEGDFGLGLRRKTVDELLVEIGI